MGEAKRRRELGLPAQTVKLPALTHDEFHTLHHLMHHRMHELAHLPEDQLTDEQRQERDAVLALHHKLFQH